MTPMVLKMILKYILRDTMNFKKIISANTIIFSGLLFVIIGIADEAHSFSTTEIETLPESVNVILSYCHLFTGLILFSIGIVMYIIESQNNTNEHIDTLFDLIDKEVDGGAGVPEEFNDKYNKAKDYYGK